MPHSNPADTTGQASLACRATAAPSSWVAKWLQGMPAPARVLDFACGAGRHAQLAASLGHAALAVDRDAGALAAIDVQNGTIETRCLDLETGPWQLAPAAFDAVIVANYLFRPRFALLCGLLAPGGRLIYETFARGNERFGKPSNPDFLLTDGELIDRCRAAGLAVLGYETGLRARPGPAVVARICAARPAARPTPASSAKLEVLPTELPNELPTELPNSQP